MSMKMLLRLPGLGERYLNLILWNEQAGRSTPRLWGRSSMKISLYDCITAICMEM